MSLLLHGPNLVDLEARVQRAVLELDPSGLSTSRVNLEDGSSKLAAELQSAPFFGGRRVVVVRASGKSTTQAAEETDGEDDSAGAATTGPNWPEIVLMLEGAPASTDVIWRSDATMRESHPVMKAAKKLGWTVIAFPIPRGFDLLAWVTSRTDSAGAKIEPEAARLLLDLLFPGTWEKAPRGQEATPPDTRLLATEIEKLACAVTEGPITRGMVAELVVDRSGYTPFALTNTLVAGNPRTSLQALEEVLSAGEPPEMILAQLASEVNRLVAAAVTPGVRGEDLATAMRANAYPIKNAQTNAAGLGPAAISTMAELLRDVDEGVKSGKLRRAGDALTPLVAELSATARGRQGRRDRDR